MGKLINGSFKATDLGVPVIKINGHTMLVYDDRFEENREICIEYGEFGESSKGVIDKCGVKIYNAKFVSQYKQFKTEMYGVVSDDGRNATVNGSSGVFVLDWVTDEEAARITEEAMVGEPIEAPPCPYKIQPENQGKLLWITGAAGMGKSTSAQLLARNKGYVYYEGDCFMSLRNPYIVVDVDQPSLAQKAQKLLKGEGLEERREASKDAAEAFRHVYQGWNLSFDESENSKKLKRFFGLLCEDIMKEKKRIGGDWAVATALAINKDWRQFLRSLLGPELIIVNLTMSDEGIRNRLMARHNGNSTIVDLLMKQKQKFTDLCQEGDDEDGVLNIYVTEGMSKNDVVDQILEKTNEYHMHKDL